ncbi:hypothetical protein PT286_00220 [Neisseriaceae bacterium ESL0693]|nr:hypothetical protein [Neisseriaceae bacterium ESL0693]
MAWLNRHKNTAKNQIQGGLSAVMNQSATTDHAIERDQAILQF